MIGLIENVYGMKIREVVMVLIERNSKQIEYSSGWKKHAVG